MSARRRMGRMVWVRVAAALLLVGAGCERAPEVDGEAAGAPAARSPEAIRALDFAPLVEGAPGSPQRLIDSPRHPGGASAMAMLMREMQASTQRTRAALLAGGPAGPAPQGHEALFSTWPTKPPEAIRTPLFADLSRGYLFALRALHEEGDAPEARARYDALLDSCVGCHQQFCPGPIVAIEGLRLPAD